MKIRKKKRTRMQKIRIRKLKKLLKDIIGGALFILALISIGCLDTAENIFPPMIVTIVSMLVLNRMYGE